MDAFKAETKPFEEHLIIFELIPAICDGIAVDILKKYLWKTLHLWFSVSSRTDFEENCYFERAIAAIIKIFDRPNTIAENVDAVVEELIWFCKELDDSHKVNFAENVRLAFMIETFSPNCLFLCFQFFKRYAGYIINMSPEQIDLMKFSDGISYRKCLIIRAEAAILKKPFVSSSNPLMWLNHSISESFDAAEPTFETNVYVINEMK